jgi:hypothetical protein
MSINAYEAVEAKITKVRVVLKHDSLGKRFWHVQYRKKPKYFVDGFIWHNAVIYDFFEKETALMVANKLALEGFIMEAVPVKPVIFEVVDNGGHNVES